jgi:agmatinase
MTIREIRQKGLGAALEEALELVHQETEAVFLTICSDILDAAHNPGGPPDFGGLTSGELMELAFQTAAQGIRGMDFVEVYPPQDPLGRSSHLAVWTFVHALVGLAASTS